MTNQSTKGHESVCPGIGTNVYQWDNLATQLLLESRDIVNEKVRYG